MAIRAASASDGPAIGAVHVRGWQAAYRGLMPQELLDGLDPERRGQGWRRMLGAGLPPGEAVLVAELDGEVKGFIVVGPSRADDDPGVGEVRSIYLLPQWWGQGIGRDLMDAGLRSLHGLGFTRAMLWVLDSNERGRRFYERGGWRSDGGSRIDDSFGPPLREVRYHRPLP